MDIIRNHTSIKDEKALVEELHSYVHRDEESSIKQSVQSKDIHLDDLLPAEHISIKESVPSWEEAIRLASKPLVRNGYVESRYVEAMVHQARDPYIVIAPHLAIPHAAPEDGVKKVGMSLLKVEEGVSFTAEETVHIIVVISAVDKKKHMHALMQLMNLAGSQKDRNRIIESNDFKEIQDLIQTYSTE
ncbi:PTS sugar transporter subunit IIA [Halobacillus mangrovi]|nr:PTS sugar transporter subunit IIA [Halobacillus mangrovi]